METINEKPIIVTQEMADRLLEVTDPSSLSREERIVYEEVVKRYRDYKNTIDYAKERGYQKGYAMGLEEGIKQAIKDCIDKLRAAGYEKFCVTVLLSIAQSLKSENYSISFISEATGLPPEEIEKL